jgi:pyruvate,water dikinase
LPLYPDEPEIIFNEKELLETSNYISKILPNYKKYQNVVKLVKTSDLLEGGTLSVIMDGETNEALAFLHPPDHWNWRMKKVEEIAEKLDAEAYGVEAMYLIGSTKTGEAGPASDIDLIVHFKGTDEQREMLLSWFRKQGKKIDQENKERTGIETGDLLDIHLITDTDIRKRTSWASHITSPYMTVKKVPLKRKEE